MLEVDRQAKRIEILEETVRRKQYELDQVRDRLERRENTIEAYTKALDVKEQLNKTLRKSEDRQKKVINAMANWIDTYAMDKWADEQGNCGLNTNDRGLDISCQDCIINYFESEVKE